MGGKKQGYQMGEHGSIELNHKRYTYSVLKRMKDGNEFTSTESTIDWNIFIECTKLCINSRVLWPLDVIISNDGSKIKAIG